MEHDVKRHRQNCHQW